MFRIVRAAALQALGETDKWKAGLGLMERASPGDYTAMVEAWRLGQLGGAELKGCAGSGLCASSSAKG
jgi:hypothetical protein